MTRRRPFTGHRPLRGRRSWWSLYGPRQRPLEWVLALTLAIYIGILVGGCLSVERCGKPLSTPPGATHD